MTSFLSIFKNRKKEYLYTLGLGASKLEALKPYMAESINLSLRPAIATMATLGIVKLPGMMTGQILAGNLPMIAIKYQIAVMILIFGAQMYNAFFILILASRFFFDDYMLPRENMLK
jgi:putative ABC transport system permease protein